MSYHVPPCSTSHWSQEKEEELEEARKQAQYVAPLVTWTGGVINGGATNRSLVECLTNGDGRKHLEAS